MTETKATVRKSARAWWMYLVLGLLAMIVYALLPTRFAHNVGYLAVGILSVLALLSGILINRPVRRLPWYLLLANLVLFVLGDAIWAYYEIVLEIEPPFPSVADAAYIGGYFALIGSMALFIRSRAPDTDAGSLIDATIIATGVGVVSWIYFMEPYASDTTLTLFARFVSIAYPLMDVLSLALLARLLLAPGKRTRSFYFLGAGLLLLLITDTAYAALVLNETYQTGHFIDFGWIASYTLTTVAALHPSMQALSDPDPGRRAKLTRRRIVLLAAASLLAPGVLAAQYLRGQDVGDSISVPFIAGASAVLFLLVLARLVGLVRRHERAVARERKLRRSGAALVAALRESEERYRLVARATNEVIWDYDLGTDAQVWDGAVESMLGYPAHQVTDAAWWEERVHPDDRERVMSGIEAVLRDGGGEVWSEEYRFLRADGGYVAVADRGYIVRGEGGEPVRIVGSVMDITERKRAEEDLAHQAFHDALTGLPNRALFMDRLEHALDRAARQGQSVAVLFTDLDRFKFVNDSLGHEVGDQLLVAVGRRLRRCLRGADTVARLGGDEFVVLLEDVPDASYAVRVAERVTEALRSTFVVEDQEIGVTTSIGIVLNAFGQYRPSDMLRDADMAMYRAKVKGKARYEIFDPEMNAYALRRLELEGQLRRAVEREQLRMYYQPIVEFESGKILGMEALVRWEHPEQGLVSPAEFIPLAEETGMILPLGQWVLEEACRQAKEWQEQRPTDEPLTISVNLSAKQFQQPNLMGEVARVLSKTGLDSSSLILEITESTVMEDARATAATLQGLKALGVSLAIDDFGTGYSSLSYLKRFPVDELKIDRSFVQGLGQDPQDAAIVRTVVGFADALGLKKIAEGVETTEQLELLRDLGCNLGQGYHFAKPLSSDSAGRLLHAQPSLTASCHERPHGG